MRYFLMYNPGEIGRRSRSQYSGLFRGLDVQVDQSQNLPALEAALAQAGNPDVTLKPFADANHLFQQAVTGSPNEYATLPAEFLPGFLDTLSDLILARVDVPVGDGG